MKTYKIPVVWTVTAVMEIEASSLDEAVAKANESPLPDDGLYLEGSLKFNRNLGSV
jgi:hypothetical protein